MRSTFLVLAGVMAIAQMPACAFDEWLSFKSARSSYDRCVEHHGDSRSCEGKRETVHSAYDDYEDEAVRSWGCKYTPDGCGSR